MRIALLRPVLLATAVAATIASCATTTSPTGRQHATGAVPQQQLDEMGIQAFNQLKAEKPQTRNARERNYATCIVNAITRQLPGEWSTRYQWETGVFVDNQANAFALPGGKMGLYTGIFRVARDQDELAAVVAHEIGHVYAHHHAERFARAQRAQMGLAAAQILAAVTGVVDPNTVGQLGGMAVQGGFLLPGSRVQESEADVIGQQLMAKAGFDPRKAVNLWQNMIAESGNNRPPQWLSTHPDPQSRINELAQRATGLMPEYEAARKAGRRPNCGP
jgi:predicted Zn-dependent protease